MADFLDDLLGAALETPQQALTRREQLYQEMMSRGARCTQCALYRCETPRGPVPGTIVPNALLTIAGEAPGGQEVEAGEVFYGPSGAELDAGLALGGAPREQCTVMNTMACQPDIEGGNLGDYLAELQRKPKKLADGTTALDPVTACHGRFVTDLAESNAQVVLAVGGRALESTVKVFGLSYGAGKDHAGQIVVAKILNQHGSPILLDDAHKRAGMRTEIICSSLHPSFAMRGKRAYKPVVRNDIARAAQIAVNDGFIDWAPPQHAYVYPSYEEVRKILSLFADTSAEVTVDIETDSADALVCKVRCIGLGATILGEEYVIVVPLHWMDGRAYWPTAIERSVRALLRRVLDTCPLVAHNSPFDTGVLLRHQLMTDDKKLCFDTMIADHDTSANDLPHDLGAVARRYFPVPMWKKDVDHKGAGSVDEDRSLHEYNVMDVTTTMRLAPKLREKILAEATQKQFATDTKLANIARDMQTLGLVVSEHVRGELSERLGKICAQRLLDFQELAGKPLNPRSPQQIGNWLFQECKIQPPLNPMGKDWKEGENWSTSTQAITHIVGKADCPQRVSDALNVLLEFRAYDKLRSTYVDGMHVRPAPEFAQYGTLAPRGALGQRGLLSRLHPNWKVHVIPTGRWASSPNVQNIPARTRAGNMRDLIVAPPGHVFVGADFEQVELRIYALQAQDQPLLEAFASGMDPHSLNAATLMSKKGTDDDIMRLYNKYMHMKKHGSKTDKEYIKYLRTIAKRFVYLETYGGEAEKLFAVMSTERDKQTGKLVFPKIKPQDTAIWHERWHTKHPETSAWQERCQRMQRVHGFVAGFGDQRKRFFPGGPDSQNAVPNHTIQASAAYITNRGVLLLHDAIPFGKWSDWTGLCLQVHDYVGCYVPTEYAEETQGIVRECLEYRYDGMDFPVDKPLATWNMSQQG